jgi:hypothetical protein
MFRDRDARSAALRPFRPQAFRFALVSTFTSLRPLRLT